MPHAVRPSTIVDVFSNLDALRVTTAEVGALAPEVLVTIPVRKPKRDEFFRVRENDEYALTTTAYFHKQTRDVYMVAPAMRSHLQGEMKVVTLVLAKTRQNVDFIIPAVLLTDDGQPLAWYESLREAIVRAKKKWVRAAADLNLGAYRIYEAQAELGQPNWPNQSFAELLDIGFRDKVIDSEDHVIIRQLRGLE